MNEKLECSIASRTEDKAAVRAKLAQALDEGQRSHQADDVAKAMRIYSQVLQEDPSHAEAMHLLGVLFIDVMQYSDAVKYISQAISINPDNPECYFNMGVALENLKQPDAAAASYKKALKLKPDFAEAREKLGLGPKERGGKDIAPKQSDTIDPIYYEWTEGIENIPPYLTPECLSKYLSEGRIRFYNLVIQLLIDEGILIENKHIVDIGCHVGYLLRLLAEHKPAGLTGLDRVEAHIEVARRVCPGGSFYKYDVYEPYNKKFDIVLCTEVLEHLLHPAKGLKNILPMINPNGCALLTVPNGRVDKYEGHINFWSPESWKVFIETNCDGFEITCGAVPHKNRPNYALIQSR